MTKTFKIGEYAVGGKIKVTIPKTLTNIKIDIIDSNFGTGQLVNQYIYYSFDRIRIERDLWQITTTYYTDMITSWINKNWKVELAKNLI
ncbi:MAG: hypothetical protein EBR82_85270 [Caulobacteraceae bacterium]|nr:hypothetical protein [Caulobacteraceae bacterium]